MSSLVRSASLIVLMGAFAGCMVDEGDAGDDTAIAGDDQALPTSETEQAIGFGCSPMVCGTNSPCLSTSSPCDGFFTDLPMNIGDTNSEGFKMLGLDMGAGVFWNLKVLNGVLTGVRPDGGASIGGPALINMKFWVKDKFGTVFRIKIKSRTNTSLMPIGTGSFPAYELVYAWGSPDAPEFYMCDHATDPSVPGEYDTLWQPKWTTVLFEGEAYNQYTKTIKPSAVPLFNVGCAGNVLAKMLLTHHAQITSGVGGLFSTPAERQAMLKMYTADYCKDGTSFTIHGEKLGWKDNHNYFDFYYAPATLQKEALWNSSGPMCLESPRLKGSVDPLATTLWPAGVDAAITAHCPATRPPTCSSLGQSNNLNNLYGQHLISAY
jgi:hypothetical protein